MRISTILCKRGQSKLSSFLLTVQLEENIRRINLNNIISIIQTITEYSVLGFFSVLVLTVEVKFFDRLLSLFTEPGSVRWR